MSMFAFVVLLVSTISRSATALTTSLDGTKWIIALTVTLTITHCIGAHINGGDSGGGVQQRSSGDGLSLLKLAAAALRSSYGHPSVASIDRVAAAVSSPPPPLSSSSSSSTSSSSSRSPVESPTEHAPWQAHDEWPGQRGVDGGYEVSMPYLVSGYGDMCDASNNNNNNINNDDDDGQAYTFLCTLPYMVTHPHTSSEYYI